MAGADAGDSALDAGAAFGVDAGPPPVPELEVVAAAFTDAGLEELIAADGVLTQVPTSELAVTITPVLADWRLRLFDWENRLVASDDIAERFDGGFRYRIKPLTPLATGRTFTLTLEAQSGATLTDGDGTSFDDWRLTFVTAGSPAPELKARSRGRRRR